ncbi:hypothetical protein BFJ63_vAg8586 [Fusarium oxysporum f. sp. narcissi]|uniref:Uncharacterized protein n=1 Tax=Fusarium oxysporum f. sp. narcissi TaxID=451672 RepID=A0A4Q2VPS3_FUSOX|nr:hypothetical protein FOWG_08279 [Fusarium oxysporum f. sp. lycopersici MN25]RYC88524.1 hypothetical protein BFJ63_vAg8586 [Fusarium oxysporum f. sp. narcissi]
MSRAPGEMLGQDPDLRDTWSNKTPKSNGNSKVLPSIVTNHFQSHMSSLRFRDQQGYDDTAIAISVQAKTEEKKSIAVTVTWQEFDLTPKEGRGGGEYKGLEKDD